MVVLVVVAAMGYVKKSRAEARPLQRLAVRAENSG
jgi:uncharacterized protein (UPF0333 family)